MGALLEVSGLVKRFGGLLATDAVSLTVEAGEIHAIIGPNGAGKTTLIGQLTGEIKPDAGSVHLAGEDITRLNVAARAHRGLGRSYQITQVCSGFTALQNVMLAVQSCSGGGFRFWQPAVSETALTEPARAALAQVGLAQRADEMVANMAHGELRQLELAMTLAMQPKVLLLDEPMAGMSQAESEEMVKLIEGLRARYGILLVEHDMDAVFRLATRISVLVYGKIIESGSPEAIRQSAAVREAYLGEEGLVA